MNLTGSKSQSIIDFSYFRKCYYRLGRVAEYYKTKIIKVHETDFDKGLMLDWYSKL